MLHKKSYSDIQNSIYNNQQQFVGAGKIIPNSDTEVIFVIAVSGANVTLVTSDGAVLLCQTTTSFHVPILFTKEITVAGTTPIVTYARVA